MLGSSVNELQSDELEAALLETRDDVADEATLDAVRLKRKANKRPATRAYNESAYLDHDVSALLDRHC